MHGAGVMDAPRLAIVRGTCASVDAGLRLPSRTSHGRRSVRSGDDCARALLVAVAVLPDHVGRVTQAALDGGHADVDLPCHRSYGVRYGVRARPTPPRTAVVAMG